MVDEIELLYNDHGIRHFCFADDAMTVNRQATIDLCDEIIRRELVIVFHATTRTDWVDDFVLKKMKESWMSQNRFRHRDRISNAARKDGQEQRC